MVMAHYDLGALLVRKENLEGGIRHLRWAVEAKPDFSEGHYNLALAYWMAGAHQEARREIDRAFELNSTDEQTRRLRNRMNEDLAR
jgi:Flp pilus assembly protein TadD